MKAKGEGGGYDAHFCILVNAPQKVGAWQQKGTFRGFDPSSTQVFDIPIDIRHTPHLLD